MSLWKIFLSFILVIIIQCGTYYYIDSVILVATEKFHINDEAQQTLDLDADGHTLYSYDKKFAAKVADDQVSIYSLGDKTENTHNIELDGEKVSFFEWLPDRNLAILTLYGINPQTKKYEVLIRQYNPLMPENKAETELKNIPADSKIVDVAYSTATNVIYMKLQVGENKFQIYRTDANYDTRRIYVQAENIGKIAVFPDKDILLYDNLKSGTVYMFNGSSGGWRTISPAGRFRLLGTANENIFIAKCDQQNNNAILAAYQGKLGIGFEKIIAYEKPEEFSKITLEKIQKI